MKTLLVLRHADAGNAPAGAGDHERPLTKAGRRDAARIGRLIRVERLVPDRVLSSTAVRALSTAAAVAETCGFDGGLGASRSLYLADAGLIVRSLSEVRDDAARVLVVGHNPGVAELVQLLTGSVNGMPSASLARITLSLDSWAAIDVSTAGKLDGFWRPDEVPAGV